MGTKTTIRYLTSGVLMLVLTAPALAEELTFREVMQALAEEMNRLNAALFVEDFDTIATAAAAIADHPSPSPEQRRRVMEALGPDVAQLRAADHAVHAAAEALQQAAEARDMPAVLTHQHRVMQGCIACHDAFRSRLSPVLAPLP